MTDFSDAQLERMYRVRQLGENFPTDRPDALRDLLAEAAYALPMESLAPHFAHIVGELKLHGGDPVLENFAVRYAGDTHTDFIEQINAAPRSVTFVASEWNGKILRAALYLKKNGWHTFFISLRDLAPEVRAVFPGIFDAVVQLPRNHAILQQLVSRLRTDVLHVHCNMFEYDLGRAVIEARGEAICVCELSDITTCYGTPEVLAEVTSAEEAGLDYAMERYICHHADGLIYQFDDGVQGVLRDRHGALPPAMQFQPWPCPEFSDHAREHRLSLKDGVLRCVFPGNTPSISETHPATLYPSRGLYQSAQILCAGGMGLEVLVDPSKPIDVLDPRMQPWHDISKRYRHFRLRHGLPPHRLSERLRRYDFGVILFHLDLATLRVRPEKLALQTANKFFAFIEAGLPILVSAEMEYMARIVEENGIGLAIATAELESTPERARALDWEKTADNVRDYAERHSMERHIHDLIGFYGALGAARAEAPRAIAG